MESEEYMNRKQQEAEIVEIEVSILIITILIIEDGMHASSVEEKKRPTMDRYRQH